MKILTDRNGINIIYKSRHLAIIASQISVRIRSLSYDRDNLHNLIDRSNVENKNINNLIERSKILRQYKSRCE